MKILFAIDNFDHGEGGAERSMQAIAGMLVRAGHQVTVLQTGRRPKSYCADRVTVHNYAVGRPPLFHDRELVLFWQNARWEPVLSDFLSKHPQELVLTQHRLSPSTVRVAKQVGLPVVSFVRAYSMFCPIQFLGHDALDGCDERCFRCLPLRNKLKYPVVRAAIRALRGAIRHSDLVVANSEYVRRVVEKFCGVRASVFYPPVSPEPIRVERDERADRILFIKPQRVKGLAVFEAITRALPQERFLVAGRIRGRVGSQLANLPNVECTGWVSDMREVYRRGRMLLGPSLWPEPFGRVFVEAAVSGIPSVASNTGGIREAVGDGGLLIDDWRNSAAWVAAIEALREPKLYRELSEKARAHAARFAPARLWPTLQRIVKESLGLDL